MALSPTPPTGAIDPAQLAFVGEVTGRLLATISRANVEGMTPDHIVTTIACMLADPEHPHGKLESQEHLATLATLSAILLVEKALR